MGHDIYAYKREKVAYYRASAFNVNNGRIYAALKCQQYNGGVSGTGEYCMFDREIIEQALEACKLQNWDDEKEFFEEILKYPDRAFEIFFG